MRNGGKRMNENNPFLTNKVYVPKPYQKETLTKAQKERNLKGIRKLKEDLKKVKGRRI